MIVVCSLVFTSLLFIFLLQNLVYDPSHAFVAPSKSLLSFDMEPGIEWTMEPCDPSEKEPHIHLEHPDTSDRVLTKVFYTEKEEARVRRRIDLWIVPVLMITYGLQ
jgi:hypothetical protein